MARQQGKIAIITGAAAGIGKASALLFAGEGASLGLLDRNADLGKVTAQAIEDAGGRAVFVETDVAQLTPIEVREIPLQACGGAITATNGLARKVTTADAGDAEVDEVQDGLGHGTDPLNRNG